MQFFSTASISLALLLGVCVVDVPTVCAAEWSCDLISDGPPGSCPDCMYICARLLDEETVELAIFVDETQSGVLCSIDVLVEQDPEKLFDDEVVPSSPISLTQGWHGLDTFDTLQTASSDPITVAGSGNFAASAGACD